MKTPVFFNLFFCIHLFLIQMAYANTHSCRDVFLGAKSPVLLGGVIVLEQIRIANQFMKNRKSMISGWGIEDFILDDIRGIEVVLYGRDSIFFAKKNPLTPKTEILVRFSDVNDLRSDEDEMITMDLHPKDDVLAVAGNRVKVFRFDSLEEGPSVLWASEDRLVAKGLATTSKVNVGVGVGEQYQGYFEKPRFSLDGSKLVVRYIIEGKQNAQVFNGLIVFDSKSGERLLKRSDVKAFSLTPDGKQIYFSSGVSHFTDGHLKIRMFDFETKEHTEIKGPRGDIVDIVVDPRNRFFVVLTNLNQAMLYPLDGKLKLGADRKFDVLKNSSGQIRTILDARDEVKNLMATDLFMRGEIEISDSVDPVILFRLSYLTKDLSKALARLTIIQPLNLGSGNNDVKLLKGSAISHSINVGFLNWSFHIAPNGETGLMHKSKTFSDEASVFSSLTNDLATPNQMLLMEPGTALIKFVPKTGTVYTVSDQLGFSVVQIFERIDHQPHLRN